MPLHRPLQSACWENPGGPAAQRHVCRLSASLASASGASAAHSAPRSARGRFCLAIDLCQADRNVQFGQCPPASLGNWSKGQ